MTQVVEFSSLGVTLRGHLYLPKNTDHKVPIVIMAHGFSATISGMVADRYAESFQAAGFAVLLYDHYSLGISDGEPRQHFNAWVQARGYIDAIDFVTTLSKIDQKRIAVWGDSTSGAEVIVVGALDDRVGAIVTQIPGDMDELPADPDGALFEAFREVFLQDDFEYIPNNISEPMPVVSFDQLGTPSIMKPLTAFRWFIEYGGRFGTNWQNWATHSSPNRPEQFSSFLCAPFLKAPILMVIAKDDEMPGASSELAREVYKAAPEPKELFEIDGGHFGLLYYPSPIFAQASQAEVDFLKKYLS